MILAVVRAIPPGRTASYADVAEEAIGSRRAARTVGWALASCPADVPWWRVVHATGVLAGVNDRVQARLLRAEGVRVRRIQTLDGYRWIVESARKRRGGVTEVE
jgi:methylated-DNA-protein-cysteine methyltransferase related protein